MTCVCIIAPSSTTICVGEGPPLSRTVSMPSTPWYHATARSMSATFTCRMLTLRIPASTVGARHLGRGLLRCRPAAGHQRDGGQPHQPGLHESTHRHIHGFLLIPHPRSKHGFPRRRTRAASRREPRSRRPAALICSIVVLSPLPPLTRKPVRKPSSGRGSPFTIGKNTTRYLAAVHLCVSNCQFSRCIQD